MSEEKTPPEEQAQKEEEAAAKAANIKKIEEERKEAERRAASIAKKAGLPPGVKPGANLGIPDHMGAANRAPKPKPPPPQRPGPPAEPVGNKMHLGPVEGAELHTTQLKAQLILKEMDKASLRGELAQVRKQLADTELQLMMKNLGEEQQKLRELVQRLSVPEGWNINRNEDGTYTLAKPPPQPPQAR